MKYGTSNYDLDQGNSSYFAKKQYQNISKSEIFRIESSQETNKNDGLIKIKDYAKASRNVSHSDRLLHSSVVNKFINSINHLADSKVFYFP